MAYVKQVWKDEVLNGPEQYRITAPGTNINGAEITLSTPIIQAGTQVTAERMNKIEQGIFDAHAMGKAGLFVPVLVGLSTTGSPVYSSQSGRYIKINNLVVVSIYLTTNSLGGASGVLRVEGMPFPATVGTMFSLVQPGAGNMYGAIGTGIGNATPTGVIFRRSGTGANVTDADFSSGAFLFVSTFIYFTN